MLLYFAHLKIIILFTFCRHKIIVVLNVDQVDFFYVAV